MTNAILHPEEIEGWRGVIEDGEVVEDPEAASAEEEPIGDDAEGRDQDDELVDEEYAGDRGEDVEDEDLEDEYQATDEEGEEISPNGQAAREREVRDASSARAPGRGRRPAGRQQRSSRSGREEQHPQRAAGRRAGTRGGNSQ
jgi:hypothetical protein